jgi:hypothetical protein
LPTAGGGDDEMQDAVGIKPMAQSRQQPFALDLAQAGRVLHIPKQFDSGFRFVDMLPTRSAAPGIAKADFVQRNGQLGGDRKEPGHGQKVGRMNRSPVLCLKKNDHGHFLAQLPTVTAWR